MPLIESDYSLAEAINLISKRFPDEDPRENLIEALHAGKLGARLICERTGKSYQIPAACWKSNDKSFIWLWNGQGGIDNRLIMGRRFYGSGTPIGRTKGDVRTNKHDLDYLLTSSTGVCRIGRKTEKETKKKEIHETFRQIPDSELDFARGGLIKVARRLKRMFPDYDTDTIRKMISADFNERKAKRNQ